MTDRELLELAAKAAGIDLHVEWTDEGPTGRYRIGCDGDTWNPLTDDGDALRLAATLELSLHVLPHRIGVSKDSVYVGGWMDRGLDDAADYRRAIVRAAAEIGRSKA